MFDNRRRQRFRISSSAHIPEAMIPPRQSSTNHPIIRRRSVDHPYHSSDSDDERPSRSAFRRRASPGFRTIFETANYALAVLNTSPSGEPSRVPSTSTHPSPVAGPSRQRFSTPRTTSEQRLTPPSHDQQVPWDDAFDLFSPPTTAERWHALEMAMARPERVASVERGRRTARMVTFQPTWIVHQLRRNRSRSNLLGIRNSHLLRRDERDVFRDDAALNTFVADLWEEMAFRHA